MNRRAQLAALDRAVYRAIAETPTPDLDRDLGRLSRAADHSKLWVAVSAAMALTGASGRRAAADGLAAIAATSVAINLGVKPLGRRRRPDRDAFRVPAARQVAMPRSTSFPSGHAGSAFAFASGAASSMPRLAGPLQAAAGLVAYSRVHTGVHYPADVVAGALIGSAIAPVTSTVLDRLRR